MSNGVIGEELEVSNLEVLDQILLRRVFHHVEMLNKSQSTGGNRAKCQLAT
jgi:hypothetical protein